MKQVPLLTTPGEGASIALAVRPPRLSPLVLPVLLALLACGKEIGRGALADEGSVDVSITARTGKKLALWTSLDVAFEGDFEASYAVELIQNGKTVATATCNPMDVSAKINSTEVSLGSSRKLSYQGKMRCELVPPADGPATVHATLHVTQRPADLKLRDISLVVKE